MIGNNFSTTDLTWMNNYLEEQFSMGTKRDKARGIDSRNARGRKKWEEL